MHFTQELTRPIGFDPDTGEIAKLGDTLTWDKTKIARFQGYNTRILKAAATLPAPTPKRAALKDGQFAEVDPGEIEYEFGSPNSFLGTHANLVPMPSAVQGTRVFYGARFANQALPLIHGEAPLVQNLADDDPQGRSFDEIFGKFAGALRAEEPGQVVKVTPDELHVRYAGGVNKHGLYNHFPLNRKTSLHHTPLVKEGDTVQSGQMLAKTNFTDDKGVLNLGVNVRVGLVPYKGHSMDDAVVISEPLAKRLTSNQLYGHDLDYKRGVKGGKSHYTGIFPNKFTNSQLEKLDEEGVAKSGVTLNPGDPIVLATRPRVVSSSSAQLGKLSTHMKNARSDAALMWDKDTPGRIVDVEKLRSGVKVNIETDTPVQPGDKLSFRSGGKMIVSKILPDEHMPRTVDGKPLEMLLNPLSIPSRVNNSLLYELLLGKAAAKNGQPFKLPSFSPKGVKWHEFVEQELKKAGIPDTEEVFDPVENRKLENPITTGMGFVQKLHHTSESKVSVRGQGAYDVQEQPLKGHDEAAKCFAPKQTINTAHGPMDIARICEKEMRVHVWSWNDVTQEWCFRPITDWFVRKAKLDELVNVKYVSNCDRHGTEKTGYFKTYNHAHLMVTKGHEVFTPEGKRQIVDLQVGDELLTWGPVITSDQKQLLIGSMLGDAYAHCDGDAIRIEHGFVQREYVKWKTQILSGLGAYHFDTSRLCSDSSIVFKITKKRPIRSVAVQLGLPYVCKWARDLFYSTGSKRVTESWLKELTLFGFSVLMLDDGSISYQPSRNRYHLSIATNSFADDELVQLRDWVLSHTGVELGIHSNHTLYTSKRADVLKIMDIIAEWVPWNVIPKSKAKLKLHCSARQQLNPCRKLNIQNKLGRVPVPIKSITPYVHDKPGLDEINVYDFTVDETHNYCASGVSVSNSKRLSGLESNALLSSGAYNVLREGSTLRGQKSDDYWRMLRMGYEPQEPGAPFVYNKLRALLTGSGYAARAMPGGKERLGFYTDRDLDAHRPLEVKTGDIVDMNNLEPIAHGLFDPAITGGAKFGYIALPSRIPNPAAETVIMKLLGITENKLRRVLAGEENLHDDE